MGLNKRAKVISLFILSCRSFLFGQVSSSNFDHYTVRDGLPSEQIYNCCQDLDGFLWIGTDAGVSRFDGRTFKNFNTSDGLGDNEIHEIFNDSQGRIWFIPFSGKLSYYYKGKIYLQNVEILNKNATSSLTNHLHHIEDTKENVYLSKAGSCFVISVNTPGSNPNVFKLSPYVETNEGFLAFNTTANNKTYCITSSKRLLLLDKNTIRDVTPKIFLQNQVSIKFYMNHADNSGFVLFSSNKGIYKLCDTTLTCLIPYEKIPFSLFECIEIRLDKYNNLWVNHLHNNTLFFKFSNGKYLEGISILKNTFCITNPDREDNIWFSANDGLYKTTYSKLQDKITFDINFKLMAQKVISCLVDMDSALWLGYSNGFVSRLKDSTIKNYNLNLGIRTNNRITQIKQDKQGNMLIGTDEAVIMIKRYSANKFGKPTHFKNENGSYHNAAIKGIFFNSKGDAFITEPIGSSLVKLNTKTLTVHSESNKLEVITARKFLSFMDSQDRLYISTINDFRLYENNNIIVLSKSDPRLNVRIKDIVEGPDGTIFLAAYNNGLIALRNKKFVAAMPQFENHSLICRKLLIKNDTLYVATNSGIGVLVFNNQKFRLIRMLSAQDGLISSDVNDMAFLGNRLFAVTSHGVSSFTTIFHDVKQAKAPVLILQNIVVDDSLCSANHPLELSYKTNHIRINFIAPVLDKPELTLYRYRFNASDVWQITSANFIEFSRLKPGNYNIEIEAKKYNSGWSIARKIEFKIEPPFYNTLWFIFLGMLVFILSLFLLIKAQVNKKFKTQLYALQQKEAIEEERNRIAADIHDDIGAELTNIVILSQILRLTNNQNEESSMQIIDKIESSSNQVITKMNEVIWTLNAKNYTIKDLMSYIRNYTISLEANTKANLDITISDTALINQQVSVEFTRNVFLVIKEILQNAIKYSNAPVISLNISVMNFEMLIISYKDNGIGFDVNKMIHGNGLNNIKRRVNQCKGTVAINSQANMGCQIEALLPLKQFRV